MTRRQVTQLVVGLAALVVAAVVYFTFDPSHSAWFPKCPFLVLTGYKCPGCGSQRAVHALLTGNLATAWHYNALLVVALPFIALLLAGLAMRRRYPRFDAALNSLWVIWTVLVGIIAWWLVHPFLKFSTFVGTG